MPHGADEMVTAKVTAAHGHLDPEIAQRFLRDVMPLHEQLQRVARRMTRNRSDAEDLVQDTLVRALASFSGYREGNLRAWLMTIMTNTAISTHRRRQLRPEVLTADIAEATVGAHNGGPNHSRSAETCVLDSMPSDHILTALRQLPEAGQEVLYYAHVEGLRYTEISDILGLPIGTVMSRVHRARQRLRRLLTSVTEQHASVEVDLPCNAPRVA